MRPLAWSSRMTVGLELNRVVGAMIIGLGTAATIGDRATGGWGANAPNIGAAPGIGGWKKTRFGPDGMIGDLMGEEGAEGK